MSRKQHCADTTDLKVLADIIKCPVRKPCCAVLVIDLSKALFTVDHCDLRRLQSIDFAEQAANGLTTALLRTLTDYGQPVFCLVCFVFMF